MNTNQTTPLITMPTPATTNIAPPLLILGVIGFGIFWVLKRFLPDEDKEKKPEAVPANAETESRRKVAETTAFRQIPAEISVKPAAVPVSSAKPFIPPLSVPPVPVVVAIPKIVTQTPPRPPIKRKFVTRECRRSWKPRKRASKAALTLTRSRYSGSCSRRNWRTR